MGGFFVLIIALAAVGMCVGLAVRRKRRRNREKVAGRRDRRGRRSTELDDTQSLLGGDAVTVYGMYSDDYIISYVYKRSTRLNASLVL